MLAAVIIQVPESSLLVTVVGSTHQSSFTVVVMVAVSLPQTTHLHIIPDTTVFSTPTLHLQLLHLVIVHHDLESSLPGLRILEECQLGKFTRGSGVMIRIAVPCGAELIVTKLSTLEQS